MEVHTITRDGESLVILLDNQMRPVKPVNEFLRFQYGKDRALNTLLANASDLKAFWCFLEERSLNYDEVTPNMILDFVDFLRRGDDSEKIIALHKESARTNATINRILSTVHSFYQYHAYMSDIENPILMENVKRPFNMFRSMLHHAKRDNMTKKSIFKVKESPRQFKLVTDDEMSVILNALDKQRDRLLYKLLYLTGARIQEALDLEIESIPVPDMTQPIAVFQGIKSKGKYRDLYVPMSLVKELDDFVMNERQSCGEVCEYIFVDENKHNKGKQLTYSAAYKKLLRLRNETGIHFNFHDLRHTFCSNLAASGLDSSVIKIIMGHEHLSTTQKYTHLSDAFIEESLERYWDKSTVIGGVRV